jgi:transposase-like protein
VEVDEAYFGDTTRGKKLGRGTERTAVLVSLVVSDEGHPRFALLHPISDVKRKTIADVLDDQTDEASALQTDA